MVTRTPLSVTRTLPVLFRKAVIRPDDFMKQDKHCTYCRSRADTCGRTDGQAWRNLISNFRRVLNVIFFFWVIPRRTNVIFRRFGTHDAVFLGHVSRRIFLFTRPTKMEKTVCFETSAYKIQTPGNLPAYTTCEDGTVCFETSAYKIQTPGNLPAYTTCEDGTDSVFRNVGV